MWIVGLLGCGGTPDIADELAALDLRASALEARLDKLEAGGSDRNARRAELQARLAARRADRAAASDKDHVIPPGQTPRQVLSDPTGIGKLGRFLLVRGPDGAFNGYRMSAMMRDSPLIRMGFRNADIVHSVDGKPLDSMQAAMEIWNAVTPSATSVVLNITRRGKPMTITVALDEALPAEGPAPEEDE